MNESDEFWMFGFETGEVAEDKGFKGNPLGVSSVQEWNRLAIELASRVNSGEVEVSSFGARPTSS